MGKNCSAESRRVAEKKQGRLQLKRRELLFKQSRLQVNLEGLQLKRNHGYPWSGCIVAGTQWRKISGRRPETYGRRAAGPVPPRRRPPGGWGGCLV
jgi:hypothetical protein